MSWAAADPPALTCLAKAQPRPWLFQVDIYEEVAQGLVSRCDSSTKFLITYLDTFERYIASCLGSLWTPASNPSLPILDRTNVQTGEVFRHAHIRSYPAILQDVLQTTVLTLPGRPISSFNLFEYVTGLHLEARTLEWVCQCYLSSPQEQCARHPS